MNASMFCQSWIKTFIWLFMLHFCLEPWRYYISMLELKFKKQPFCDCRGPWYIFYFSLKKCTFLMLCSLKSKVDLVFGLRRTWKYDQNVFVWCHWFFYKIRSRQVVGQFPLSSLSLFFHQMVALQKLWKMLFI